MNFGFELILKDGMKLFVSGEADIDYACECCNRPHIQDIMYETMLDPNSGIDFMENELPMTEVDKLVDRYIYTVIKEEKDLAG